MSTLRGIHGAGGDSRGQPDGMAVRDVRRAHRFADSRASAKNGDSRRREAAVGETGQGQIELEHLEGNVVADINRQD